jgi:glycosyltransferase involved in cell wall biosynthesis
MSDLVTAIVPTFNYGRFIGRAVESVLAQTHPSMQCVVVDDGSNDETRTVLASFGTRIEVVHQDHHGVSAARNAALARARGSFVALLDADDRWHPRKIEVQLAFMKQKVHLGCSGCGLEHIAPGRPVDRTPGKRNAFDPRETLRLVALRKFWVTGSGSGAMIRRTVLDKVGVFDESLEAAEDWDLWLRIAAASTIDNVPEVLVSIHRHGTGMFRNAALMERNQWRVYHKAIAAWPDVIGSTDRRRIRALILADAAVETPEAAGALAYILRSLVEWPFNYRRARLAILLAARRLSLAG